MGRSTVACEPNEGGKLMLLITTTLVLTCLYRNSVMKVKKTHTWFFTLTT